MTGLRLDKWLWAARFFKTRSLAAQACELGRVQVAEQNAKPARAVQPGNMLRIATPGGEFEVRVVALSEMRGPAAVAQTLYEETDASRAARAKAAELRRLNWEPARVPGGRPSKRDRRVLSRFQADLE
ncbi:MAG: RNA-binding S4 domain-containing protein [Bryobacteraceae bacterium]